MAKTVLIYIRHNDDVPIEKLRQIVADNHCTIKKEFLDLRTVTVEVPEDEESEYLETFNEIAGITAFGDLQFSPFKS